MALDLRSSELEHAFIKERICNVEKHFSEISLKLSNYIKKIAHVRDSGDNLAKCILCFASKENLNLSLRNSLTQFADILLALQEYRDAQIQRIDVKVLLNFSNYSNICKTAKAELKTSFEIRAKELSKKNQLEKTRSKNPSNWQKIAQAERAVSEAKSEATRATMELSRKMDDFEKQKILDMKNSFLEFIKIELLFHAKAVELYTEAYNTIKDINVEEDLNEFRSHFRSYISPQDFHNLFAADGNNKVSIQFPTHTSNPDLNEPIKGDFVATSNASLKSGTINNISDKIPTTSNTYTKSLHVNKADGSPKSENSTKTSPSRRANSSVSFDSFVESKFVFGDHCL